MSAAIGNSRNSYDVLPYPSHAHPGTHPGRMAAVAALFGMRAADVARARILELGCASGGNLIALAEGLPGATCLGIDGSRRQVEAGRETIAALGLANVEIVERDLGDDDAIQGEFDYIICHGVYSWVPAAVRARILEICRRHLGEQGIAYISYNTLPGWHGRQALRDLAMYAVRGEEDVAVRVKRARELFAKLPATAPLSAALRGELTELAGKSDAYLMHEYLSEVNEPCYFHEFANQAASAGLQYLGEARVADMWTGALPNDARRFVETSGGDLIQQQQYLDFLTQRPFRQSLVCRDDVVLNRAIGADRLAGLYVAAHLQSAAAPGAAVFRTPAGETINTTSRATTAALAILGERWPRQVQFEELTALVAEREGRLPAEVLGQIGPHLVKGHVAGIVELSLAPFACAHETGVERPQAWELARREVSRNGQVTNGRHECVTLEPLDREVLMLLDGQRDRNAIVDELLALERSGRLRVAAPAATPTGETATTREILQEAADRSLRRLAELSMLRG
jgi:methyltransferase-like protein/SAM-dependent methyltransferase